MPLQELWLGFLLAVVIIGPSVLYVVEYARHTRTKDRLMHILLKAGQEAGMNCSPADMAIIMRIDAELRLLNDNYLMARWEREVLSKFLPRED